MTGFLCALPFLSGLFAACAEPPPLATGYVEGAYTLIAPVATAHIGTIHVARGDRVEAGTLLVSMETQDAEIRLAEAEAALAKVGNQLENLTSGKRPEEIRVIEAALASAMESAKEADRTAERYKALAERGAATTAQRDDAETALRVANAKVAEIEANLVVARLPARPQEIAAAKAAVENAQAARDFANWSLEQRQLVAAGAGQITDVIRNEGEIAGPSAPVLTYLGDTAVKLRLYVPEPSLSQIEIGSLLAVHCDGCADDVTAQITYISDGPEFTPPVIYSLENRQKLVYLIEAAPANHQVLKPGQIVDVALMADEP